MPCKLESREGVVAFTHNLPRSPSGYAEVTTYCIASDPYEPNDTRATATDLTDEVVSGSVSVSGATVYPVGDEDWFVVRGVATTRVSVGLREIVVDVYRDGTFVAKVTAGASFVNGVPGAHDWELHVTSVRGPAPIQLLMMPF